MLHAIVDTIRIHHNGFVKGVVGVLAKYLQFAPFHTLKQDCDFHRYFLLFQVQGVCDFSSFAFLRLKGSVGRFFHVYLPTQREIQGSVSSNSVQPV